MHGPNFVLCPLVDENIEPIDCIENSDAVDGIIKKETVKSVNGMGIDTTTSSGRWYFCTHFKQLRWRNREMTKLLGTVR